MNIVIANGPGVLDNGKEVILFPSRWDSAVPGRASFQFYPYELGYLSSLLKLYDGWLPVLSYPHYSAERIAAVRMGAGL